MRVKDGRGQCSVSLEMFGAGQTFIHDNKYYLVTQWDRNNNFIKCVDIVNGVIKDFHRGDLVIRIETEALIKNAN